MDYSWLDDNLGLDEESDRTIQIECSSMHSVPPIPGLEKYEDVHISYSEQTFYGIAKATGALVEIPRSEWMSPQQYRDWCAAGCPKQIHVDED